MRENFLHIYTMKYPTLGQAILLAIIWTVALNVVGGLVSADVSRVKNWGTFLITLWFVAGLIGQGNEGFRTQDIFHPRQLLADLSS